MICPELVASLVANMANAGRIGKRDVDALKPGGVVWDAAVAGFGARRQRSANVTYVLKYRTDEGLQRWLTIGRHGSPWTPETARNHAKVLLGQLAQGIDPAEKTVAKRKPLTVSELCSQYMQDAEAGRVLSKTKTPKRASTLAVDKGRVERHIVPVLGKLKVAAVTRQDVERLLHAVADGRTACEVKTKSRGLARVTGGQTAANRAVGLLGGIFSYAVRQGLRPDNPVAGAMSFADTKRDRRMSDVEYRAFGSAIAQASDFMWPPAVAVARFLTVTGWRRGEAIGLQWADVDLTTRTAVLRETKSGKSMRPLCRTACEIIAGFPRSGPLVFPASRGEGTMTGFPKYWAKIMQLGGLPRDVSPHVLRHSYSSAAAELGYSESTIAALIGHARQSVTSRYIHSADTVLLAAADGIANAIGALMEPN